MSVEDADEITGPNPYEDGGPIDPSKIEVKIEGVTLDKVQSIKGALPWDVEKDRSLCGQTQIVDSEKINWSVTIEAKVAYSTFDELLTIVDDSSSVFISTAAKAGEVALDTIQYKRTDEEDSIETEHGEEPLYVIQVQTQDDEQSNNTFN